LKKEIVNKEKKYEKEKEEIKKELNKVIIKYEKEKSELKEIIKTKQKNMEEAKNKHEKDKLNLVDILIKINDVKSEDNSKRDSNPKNKVK